MGVEINHAGPAPGEGAAAVPSPSPAVGADEIVDMKGRRLKLRELTLLEETDLIAAMDVGHAENGLILGRGLIAGRVAAIDGVAMPVPRTTVAYRAMLQAVGREGIVAVIAATAPTGSPDADPADALKDQAKN